VGWARRQRPYLLVLLGSTFVVSTWFRTGTFIATGDMGPFIRRGWAPEAVWSWNHSVSGAGSAAYDIARGAEFLLIGFWSRLGFDEYTAQWSWYTIIYGLVGFGIAYAARAFVRSDTAVVVAGMFGVLNGFFLTRLPNPLNIISVGCIALITGIAIRVAQGRRIPPPLAGFALMPTAFLGFNPPMLVVAYAWALGGTSLLVLVALGRRPLGRLLWWFVKALPWVLLLNMWWLLPLAQGFTGGGGAVANADFSDPTNWIWAQINNTVPNILTLVANWAWFRPQYLPFAASLDNPWWIWVRYLLPALVFLAPIYALRRNRRVALTLMGFIAVFVFLAKGLMPPFTSINLWLYLHVPGFWLFREPMSKLGQLLVLFFAILLAFLVEGLIARARVRRDVVSRVSLAAAMTGVVLVLAYPFPLYNGTVMPDDRPSQPSAHVRVPDFWWQMASTIDADKRPGKVLVLPLDDYYQMPTTWGFFGVDSVANLLLTHPVITPKPDGYFSDVPGMVADVRALETALVSGDLTSVPRLLDAMQVSRIVLRHDLVRGLSGRSFADDAVLGAALAKVPGMTRTVSGSLDLWLYGDGTSPTVRTYAGLVEAPADPQAGAAAIGSMGTDRAIRAAKAVAAKPGPHVVSFDPQVSTDVVSWPVPAVESGAASTTVDVSAGTYRLAQRARSAPPLVPSVDAATSSLLLSDPTVVTVDGVARSSRPALRVPVPTTDVVAVTAGTRTVSLDGWGRDRLPRPPGAAVSSPTVVVGSATPLTVWTPSAEPAKPSPFSDVYDCDNYEPRPAVELGLRRTLLETREGLVVRLSAKDHAACSRVVVTDAKPGRTYRIRMEYRTVTGKRPQICVWQEGTDGCELTARPVLSTGWTTYESVVTMDTVATGLQVVLQANVGQRLLPPTTVEFRGVRVEALDAAVRTTVFPPEVPETSVALAAGTHTLAVTGGPAGSVLADFEPLQDCFRYDDQTPQQAGLFAKPLLGEPQPAYSMGARAHTACVGATVPAMGDTSLYALAFDAKKVALRDPKVCLYLRGPDRCSTLPTTVWTTDWQPYSTLISPDPGAVETRLYLYGLRDLAGKSASQVDYRAVRIVPVASTSTVVLVRDTATGAAPTPRWARTDPAHYPVSVTGAPTVLALRETSAPGWQFQGLPAGTPAPEHTTVQGWANAWILPAGTHAGTLVYAPSKLSRYALLLLPVAVLLAIGEIVGARWWRRRRAARSEPRGRREAPSKKEART
jgi:arabinofuranan 3-O-arabinosyltransferase